MPARFQIERREQSRQNREEQNGPVDVNGRFARKRVERQAGREQVDALVCHQDSASCAHKGKHDRFSQQLANDSGASRAYGSTHRKLMLTDRSAGEHQDGNVGTTDEKQE